ncbi:MAG: TetR/AcrR family transcriptional regulator [Acidimicrobiaceae bacterium]|nr:TetR/AcrR family transcriptional regulator [Acidimicrobiaceae bacterium]
MAEPPAMAVPAVRVVGGTPARQRRLRPQGHDTLRRLTEAAIVVLRDRGYHHTRVDDIVRKARASHGTFYLYFASKDDLFLALQEEVTEEMRELADGLPAMRSSQAGREDLRAWLGRFYDLYEHYYPVIQAWTEANVANPQLARAGAAVLRRFTDQLVERIVSVPRSPVADARAAALAMVSMVERASFYAVSRVVPVEREHLLDEMTGILYVGLFGGRGRG